MKAIILLLILLPAWAQGDIAVGIGNGLSIGVDGGGLYYSPPGSGVSIEIDSPEPKRNRNNNARRNDYDDEFLGYEQPWPQEKAEPQIMPSVPSAPSVGKIHQIHRKECFLSSRRTDESNYKHRQIVGCIPKKSAFHRALVDDAQGKGTRWRDLLAYYDR